MNARRPAVLVIVAILSTATLLAQSRNPRGPATRRGSTAARGAQPEAAPSPGNEPSNSGAGVAVPPRQGYVVIPDSAPAGTAIGAVIPSDPLELGYWELYDRQKTVTLTGRVTKVDWTNPNAYIYLSAEGGMWAVESSFIQFRQSSVTPAVHVDETITVMGYLPKEEPVAELPAKKSPAFATYLKTNHLIRAGEITTVYGQKLNMGRPPSEKEMADRLKCSALGC